MMGWTGDYGDPDNFYYAHFGPGATADLGAGKSASLQALGSRTRY